ncbi:hypothetical protein K438DRAFT_1808533 [Mycena galopus ATCC 62051]|nr:hypothetical protein K438DRAFT_1808533 [Mycena galopus ATCC 62051]
MFLNTFSLIASNVLFNLAQDPRSLLAVLCLSARPPSSHSKAFLSSGFGSSSKLRILTGTQTIKPRKFLLSSSCLPTQMLKLRA